jgi:Cu-processing system permease protein
MKRMFAIIAETFLLLRRDRVFLPVAVIMIATMLFAHLASYWGTEEFQKILFDLGLAGINLTGTFVAIFWGTKLIADSKKEGSLELELAAPVSRSFWVVGRFIGLCATLIFIGMIMILAWQFFMLVNSNGWMQPKHLVIFAYQILGWVVLSSVSVCLASISAQTTAMFSCFSLWILGMVTGGIASSLSNETPVWLQELTRNVAKIWDFQRFNLIDFATTKTFPANDDLLLRGVYGLILALFFASLAAVLFTKKDVVSQ